MRSICLASGNITSRRTIRLIVCNRLRWRLGGANPTTTTTFFLFPWVQEKLLSWSMWGRGGSTLVSGSQLLTGAETRQSSVSVYKSVKSCKLRLPPGARPFHSCPGRRERHHIRERVQYLQLAAGESYAVRNASTHPVPEFHQRETRGRGPSAGSQWWRRPAGTDTVLSRRLTDVHAHNTPARGQWKSRHWAISYDEGWERKTLVKVCLKSSRYELRSVRLENLRLPVRAYPPHPTSPSSPGERRGGALIVKPGMWSEREKCVFTCIYLFMYLVMSLLSLCPV